MGWGRRAGYEWAEKHPTGSAILGICVAVGLIVLFIKIGAKVAAIFAGLYLGYCIFCLVGSLR